MSSEKELEAKIANIGFPAVLKTNTLGYDGKGQIILKDKESIPAAWKKIVDLKSDSAVLEAFVDFKMEVSVIVCRGFDGRKVTFPVAENQHENHILKTTIVPANVSDKVKEAAKNAGRTNQHDCQLILCKLCLLPITLI